MVKAKKDEKTFLNKIKMDFKQIIMGSSIINLLFLLFGIIVYLNPLMTATLVGVMIGLYFIVFGLFDIYEFLMRSVSPMFSLKIMGGLINIVLGILIMFNPFKIVKFLTFMLGLYLIFVAIFKIVEAFKYKKFKYDGWSIILVTSIVLLVFGVFIAINPLASMDMIEVAGIFIILSSVLELCNLLMIYSKAKEIEKLFKKEN